MEAFKYGLLLSFLFTFGLCDCGYETCNLGNPENLNVHLVPHTHDDVGWLKTVDQYYYGANQTIVQAGVQYILDTVIPHLLADPARRFIYVEMAFFARWWREQNDQMKSVVKMLVNEAYPSVQKAGVLYILDTVIQQLLKNPDRRFIYVEIAFFKRWWDEQTTELKQQVAMLVKSGRLEFILGGWCMNDEAATHYNAIIDQMSYGMTFLNDTFGACARPRVAWQIDPFGHSREQASLFAQMGFDGLFFGRLDYQDKELREKQHRMEEIWRGSANLNPPTADLFTGVNENGYGPPSGFCFDTYCGDQPIMDDPNLEDNNVDEKVKLFVDAAHHQARHFKTNHIMMTMGSDFQYENAVMWFKNLDKLIKYVNAANTNVTVFYSTPSCYLYALNKAGSQWTVKTDDFFPYADRPHSFWTGYFTSRPGLKGYSRETNKFLQVCNQLDAISQFNQQTRSSSNTPSVLREAMGVAQHHDAITGTSKQHVANDYAKRLYIGRKACKSVISEAITGSPDNLHYCDYLNISLCNYTQDMNEFFAFVYNPLARPVSKYIRLPINCPASNTKYTVMDSSNKAISVEVVSVTNATKMVRRNRGNANCDLLFEAQLPALGYEELHVTKTMTEEQQTHKRIKPVLGDITISNEYYSVKFDGGIGLMYSITNLKTSITQQVQNQLLWYNASTGNEASSQQSGAYIFRPNSTTSFACSSTGTVELYQTQGEGDLVQEVIQKFSNWAWQAVRLYKGKPYVEVEWTVGPIPIQDGWGKEIISRYDTDINNDDYFYTDANGREVLERKKNYRPTWPLHQSEQVAGNYFPINSRIYIKDQKTQFTVLTDRSQGGASLKTGSLEVMVHRRLLGEDGKGVGEPLNETGQFGDGLIMRGKHYLILDTVAASGKQHRLLAEELYMDPLVAFQNVTATANLIPPGSLVVNPLPENVHLLTLATRENGGGYLVRLEHQFEKTDDPQLSQPVTVSLATLFKNFTPTSAEELLLAANVLKDDVTRLQWQAMQKSKRDVEFVAQFERPYPISIDHFRPLTDQFDVTLDPMQIRTFLLR